MGSGSVFNSALSTRGGRKNIISNFDIRENDCLAEDIINEMIAKGIKFTKEMLVFAARLDNGRIIFLERGNDYSGLEHIKNRHASHFSQAFGVKEKELGTFLYDVIKNGELVTSFRNDTNGREGYRSVYYWKGDYVVIYAISANGYITTAMPSRREYFTSGGNIK